MFLAVVVRRVVFVETWIYVNVYSSSSSRSPIALHG